MRTGAIWTFSKTKANTQIFYNYHNIQDFNAETVSFGLAKQTEVKMFAFLLTCVISAVLTMKLKLPPVTCRCSPGQGYQIYDHGRVRGGLVRK